MANFFSADYWKALYFKAFGGQETATDPNAMSGTFAGLASWTGTLDLPAGDIAGAFAGSAAFTGTLDQPSADIAGTFVGVSAFTGTLDRMRGGSDAGPAPKKRRVKFIAPSWAWVRDNFASVLGGASPDAAKQVEQLVRDEAKAAKKKKASPAAVVVGPTRSDVAALDAAQAELDRIIAEQAARTLASKANVVELHEQAQADFANAVARLAEQDEEEILLLLLAA